MVSANNGNGVSRSTTADVRGQYVLANLPAGAYTVRVSSKGFAPARQRDIVENAQMPAYAASADPVTPRDPSAERNARLICSIRRTREYSAAANLRDPVIAARQMTVSTGVIMPIQNAAPGASGASHAGTPGVTVPRRGYLPSHAS